MEEQRQSPDPAVGTDGSHRPRSQVILPLVFCLVAVPMAHHPMILSGFDRIQADQGDTRLVNYLLEHSFRYLRGDPLHSRFWDPPFFYPEPNVGAFTDQVISLAPPYWLLRALTPDPDTAFQLWMISLTVANYAAGYLFLRRIFFVGAVPAALAATLFAAGSSRVAQMGHQQLLCHIFLVAALFALFRVFRPVRDPGGPGPGAGRWPTRRWLILFFASLTAQFYAGFYNGFFLVLAVSCAVLAALFLKRARAPLMALLRLHMPTIIVLGALTALALVPMLKHYTTAAHRCGGRAWHDVGSPRLQSWLHLGSSNWLYGGLADLGMFRKLPYEYEQRLGLGLLTTAVALIGLWRGRKLRGLRMLLLVTAAIAICITAWWDKNAAIWRYFFTIYPGATGIRVTARFGVLLLIPAAIGLSLFLHERSGRPRSWKVALAIVCLFEQLQTTPSFDKHEVRTRVDGIAAQVDRSYAAFYVAAYRTPPLEPWMMHVDAMWAGMSLGMPTVNGYSGMFPPSYLGSLYRPDSGPTEADLPGIRTALAEWARQNHIDPDRIQWLPMDQPGAVTSPRL